MCGLGQMTIFPNVLAKATQFSETLCTAEMAEGHTMSVWTSTSAPSSMGAAANLWAAAFSFPWQTVLSQVGRSQAVEQRRYLMLGQLPEPWLEPKSAAGSGFACWIIELSLHARRPAVPTTGCEIVLNGTSLSEMKEEIQGIPLPARRQGRGLAVCTPRLLVHAGKQPQITVIWEKKVLPQCPDFDLGVGQFGHGSHSFSFSPGYLGWLSRAPPAAGSLPNSGHSKELPAGC